MDETLGEIHLVAKYLAPCEPMKLKIQIIFSQNTIVIQALDYSYKYSHLIKGEK